MKLADLLRGKGVYVATPMYGGQCVSSYVTGMMSLTALCTDAGVNLGHCFLTNESLINRARNTLLAAFYATDASHLMWIDADVGFHGGDVVRLLAASVANGVDLVCGAYPMKTIERGPMMYAAKPKEGGAAMKHPLGGDLIEVDRPATGFLMMTRRAVSKMRDAYRETLSYTIKHNFMNGCDAVGLFECMIENGELLSEDYSFAERWKLLGGKTWMDPTIKLTHTGTHVFDAPPIGEWLSIT